MDSGEENKINQYSFLKFDDIIEEFGNNITTSNRKSIIIKLFKNYVEEFKKRLNKDNKLNFKYSQIERFVDIELEDKELAEIKTILEQISSNLEGVYYKNMICSYYDHVTHGLYKTFTIITNCFNSNSIGNAFDKAFKSQ